MMHEIPPKAGALVEALRGLGYTLQTAISDIIDNSISAKAKNIDIDFIWDEYDSYITISDDGVGMTKGELFSAMRLGEINPKNIRGEGDLGRFGLGLKTASFSQCRRFCVSAKKHNIFSSLYWDLDYIAADNLDRWVIHDGPPAKIKNKINEKLVNSQHGTIVSWECIDRVVTKGSTLKNFLDLIDKVEVHLSMVFHRYLDGSYSSIKININGKAIKAWDPFMLGNPSKPSHYPANQHPFFKKIEAQVHVLPHKDRLSPEDYIKYQGPDGWTAQQGFYVYRGGRMLVAGSWLGLGSDRCWTKDEAHRLVRIRLDIPTTDDYEWNIDVKKSNAKPPVNLQLWLKKIAEFARNDARRVFAHRGHYKRSNTDKSIAPIWIQKNVKDGFKYSIDLNHPLIEPIIKSTNNSKALIALLKVIEETVPVQKIWLDTEENKELPISNFNDEPTENIKNLAKRLLDVMIHIQEKSLEESINILKVTEPFNNYQEIFDEVSQEFR